MGLASPPPGEGLGVTSPSCKPQPCSSCWSCILPALPSRAQSCTAPQPSPLHSCSSASLPTAPGLYRDFSATRRDPLFPYSGKFPNRISCCRTNLCKSNHKPGEIKPLPDFTGQSVLGRASSCALGSSAVSTSLSTKIYNCRASIFLST